MIDLPSNIGAPMRPEVGDDRSEQDPIHKLGFQPPEQVAPSDARDASALTSDRRCSGGFASLCEAHDET